jgi:glycosyltransferase involved in cell wall biosynthesis
MQRQLVYDVVTPTRNEAANLPRLAAALAAQERPPRCWTIVDTGSTDETLDVAATLAERHDWIRVRSLDEGARSDRGRPVVRAIETGGADSAHGQPPDVFVNVDADVSFEPGYMSRLLDELAADPQLGIVSGTCLEFTRGEWRPRFNTGSTVWGATRAYRWECFQAVLPLEQRLGWDGIDEIKANSRGWRTMSLRDHFFFHHRPEGVRDGAFRARREQGRTAYYMGYRVWYLLLRSLRHAAHDPGSLAMVWGYAGSALRRAPRSDDAAARSYLQQTQSLRLLPQRARETLGL